MKIILHIGLLLNLLNSSFCQIGQENCETAELESGIIFGTNCYIPYKGTSNRILLTQDQISEAENELLKQINSVLGSDPRVDNFQITNPEKYFRKYKRQYFGYVDEQTGNYIVFMNLLNFKGTNPKKNFDSWKTEFVIGFGDFYEKNTRRYEYDLTEGLLRIP